MDEVVKWGPFLLQSNMFSIIISGFVGYWLVKLDLNQNMKDQKKKIEESIGNTIFLGFAIWKLSLLLINPISVVNNPMTLIYFSGGYRGWIMALMIVFIYIFYQSKKQQVPIWKYVRWYGLGFSAAYFTYHLLFAFLDPSTRIYHVGQLVLSTIFIGWFKKAYTENAIFQGLLWFGIGQISLLFLSDKHITIGLGLSGNQLIFLFVALLGFWGPWVQKKMG